MTINIKQAAAISLFFVLSMTVMTAFGAGGDLWRKIDDTALSRRPMDRTRIPERYSAFRLDTRQMREMLASAPEEFTGKQGTVIQLPMPDGTLARFRVEHSLVVEPGLVAKYPDLGATYSGVGIDDPAATVRLDFLPSGFHAMILSSSGTVMIDPYAKTDTDNYVSYFKGDLQRIEDFNCEVAKPGLDTFLDETIERYNNSARAESAPEVTSGTTLRTYRLAVAGNFEYCAAASVGGNTVNNCLAAMVLIMNRVNGVYERDVALRMVMVASNNLIAYAADNVTCPVPGGTTACTAANDPYANDGTVLNTNTGTLNTVIGSGSYDIGHVFTTGSGGVAGLQTPCGANKGRGTTGLPNPIGDPFAIDYVAHEMGHQWGGNHTFNGTDGSCGGNRAASAAYETGSGITIMAYAGICGNQNLAANSIDTFHVKSLEEIVAYSQTGNGNTCDVETATGNTPPTAPIIAFGTSFNIPRNTPFALTASATDVNNDALTYDWQEYDTGGTTGTTAVPNTDSDGTARPIFRPYLPVSNGTRYFPSLPFILNNANVPPSTTGAFLTGELLPAITRTMNFQVVVRDNRAGGGGINTATATVNVSAAGGPFVVTAPNTAINWNGGTVQTVTWDVAGTTAAPINAANVKISLSADGGQTFPTVLAASTPNDGSEVIVVPNNITTIQARIKVEAVGNIFFDISNANFMISTVGTSRRAPFDYDGDDKTDVSIYRPALGQWWYQRSSTGVVAAGAFGTSTDRIVPADYTADGRTDIAFWRPGTGEWFILRSEDNSFFSLPFGTTSDVPVPGDYDNDGKADTAVFRPSTNTWFIQKSGGGTDIIGFGVAGDKPVVGDYDGDNKTDIAIFRPGSGQWWVRRSSDASVFVATFGTSTDKPVQGRYTADNKTDIAIWRPSSGEWFVLRSEDFSFFSVPFGTATDIPVAGDYDGDDRTDFAVFRPSDQSWYVQRTTAGILIQQFGLSTDLPTPNAFVP